MCLFWLQIYLQLAEAQQKELSALKAELTAVKAAAEAAGGDANAAKAVGMRAYKECARIKVGVLRNAYLGLCWCRRLIGLPAQHAAEAARSTCPPVQSGVCLC